jgi:hypothetical protein
MYFAFNREWNSSKRSTQGSNSRWAEIVWEEDGIVVRDVKYGPVLNFFWCKRKKLVTGTPTG